MYLPTFYAEFKSAKLIIREVLTKFSVKNLYIATGFLFGLDNFEVAVVL